MIRTQHCVPQVLTAQRVASTLRAAGYPGASGGSWRTLRPGFKCTQDRKRWPSSVAGFTWSEPVGPVMVHYMGGRNTSADKRYLALKGYKQVCEGKGWKVTLHAGHIEVTY